MKRWTNALVAAIIGLIAAAIASGFTAQIVVESRLSRVEAMVETIREDVGMIKQHLLPGEK